MDERDKAWREIQALIGRDKAAALEEFRLRPLRPAEGPLPRREPRLDFRTAALAAASLLLVAALAAFLLLHAGWRNVPARTAGSELLAESLFYAAAGQEPAASGHEAQGQASPFFTALAGAALRPRAARQADTEADSASQRVVERGDPDAVRRAIGNAIRENAFERALSQIQHIHAQEA